MVQCCGSKHFFNQFFTVETAFQSSNHSSHAACRWRCQLCSHALRGNWEDAVGVNSRHMNLVFAIQQSPQEDKLFILAFTHVRWQKKSTCMHVQMRYFCWSPHTTTSLCHRPTCRLEEADRNLDVSTSHLLLLPLPNLCSKNDSLCLFLISSWHHASLYIYPIFS